MRRIALLLAVACAVPAMAGVWVEVPDAPDGPIPSQATVGVGALTDITGSLADSIDHVDTYCINITNVADFYATTAATVGNGRGFSAWDSRLYLWNANGGIVLGNDDTFNHGLTSTVSDPSTFPGLTGGLVNPDAAGISLTPGTYNLSITYYSNEARDSAGNLVATLSGNFSDLHGPNTAAGPFASWDNDETDGGTYNIELGGAAFCVPEPASLALIALGALFAGRRR